MQHFLMLRSFWIQRMAKRNKQQSDHIDELFQTFPSLNYTQKFGDMITQILIQLTSPCISICKIHVNSTYKSRSVKITNRLFQYILCQKTSEKNGDGKTGYRKIKSGKYRKRRLKRRDGNTRIGEYNCNLTQNSTLFDADWCMI